MAKTTIKIGDKDVVLLPLNWRQLDELQETITAVMAGGSFIKDPEHRKAIRAIVFASVSRSDNDITDEQVAESLDVGNAAGIIAAIFGRNGVVPAGEGAPGEA